MPQKDKEYKNKEKSLNPKPREVLEVWLKLGFKETTEIAEKLKLTPNTVCQHIKTIIDHFLKKNPYPKFSRKDEFIEYMKINNPAYLHPKYLTEDENYSLINKPLHSNSRYYHSLRAKNDIGKVVVADEECYKIIGEQKQCLIKLKGYKESGKSTLINCLKEKFSESNIRVIRIDLKNINHGKLEKSEEVMSSYLEEITKQLDIKLESEDYWQKRINDDPAGGSEGKLDDLLNNIDCSDNFFLLITENVDKSYEHPVVAKYLLEFIRKIRNDYGQIRQIISYSTDCYLSNIPKRKSPFNVGQAFILQGFTIEQVRRLIIEHGVNLPEEDIRYLFDWMGGRPYFWQLALYYIRKDKITVEDFARITIEESKCEKLLSKYYDLLKQNEKLLKELMNVVSNDCPVEVERGSSYILEGMGLIVKAKKTRLAEYKWIPSCRMCQEYFREHGRIYFENKKKYFLSFWKSRTDMA